MVIMPQHPFLSMGKCFDGSISLSAESQNYILWDMTTSIIISAAILAQPLQKRL
jgi:hypothetical protein